MIAISRKLSSSFFFILIFITTSAQVDCNKAVSFKRDLKFLPKEVCLPAGYIVAGVHTRENAIDFNQDGLLDCVFSTIKKGSDIGDSSFLYFYKQYRDSTFELTQRFGNLYPVQFDPNVEHPDLKDEKLAVIFECYGLPDPLYSIDIHSDTVTLIRRIDGRDEERIKFVYKFDQTLNDWRLVQKKRLIIDRIELLSLEKTEMLSDFSYCSEQ